MDDNQINTPTKFSWGPKLIFIILAGVILVEIIFAVRTLTKPLPPTPPPSKVTSSSKATISLAADKKIYQVGETIPVNVQIDTSGKKTDGTDLLLHFDPKALDASPAAIIKGTIYGEYPVTTVDTKNGIISISGISSLSKEYSGTGLFATINFTAKTKGQTSILVDFTPNLTTDSNIVETGTGKDILEQVANLSLTIQ